MSLFRKDEDEENKIDFLIESQHTLRKLLEPLQANIERTLSEDLELARTAQQQHLKTQVDWLAEALQGVHQNFLKEVRQQKSEMLNALRIAREENQGQISALRNEILGQGAKISAQNSALNQKIEEHRAEWREALDFEIRNETPIALKEWCEQILDEFQAFGSCSGMVRLLAGRLMQHFQSLRLLEGQIESDAGGFESRIEELGRTLFAPELGVSWHHLTPANSHQAQRKTLLDLETAVWQFRAHIRETLRRKSGIAPLEIVPMETRFDARFHESSEFLEVPTHDPARHNLILAVERPGYEKTAPDGTKTLLQMARVRRSVLNAAPQMAAPTVEPMAETAPSENVSPPGFVAPATVDSTAPMPQQAPFPLQGLSDDLAVASLSPPQPVPDLEDSGLTEIEPAAPNSIPVSGEARVTGQL